MRGPVVLSVHADRVGRLWRIAETCARCAAATVGCRVLATALPPSPPTPSAGQTGLAQNPPPEGAPVFSDAAPPSPVPPADDASSAAPAVGSAAVPSARAASPASGSRRAKRWGKIAQRTVPHDLQPDVLRVELIELGDAFRAYQQRTEPDLVLLADLHERKARAFSAWADATGDRSLRREAHRAQQAAETTREMHQNRVGEAVCGNDPVVERLLTRNQAGHARTVLDYVPSHAPHPEAAVHLAVLLLTLRAARAGTGNITGQDVTGWLQGDAERVLEQLVTADWLRLPGSVPEALASRPEDPVQVTVPTLLPEQQPPFTFGKTHRARISGWAQKIVGDRKLRKKKLGASTRLLALYAAAHTRSDGSLGHAGDGGLDLDKAAAFCALQVEDLTEHAELLVAADWLAQADTTSGSLRGQLTERALPLGGLL